MGTHVKNAGPQMGFTQFLPWNGLRWTSSMSLLMSEYALGIGSSSPCLEENIYDSLIGINSNNRLKGVIIPLAKLLSRILHATSYYGKSSDPKSEK